MVSIEDVTVTQSVGETIKVAPTAMVNEEE
jgi:hypothetical protein